MKTWRLIIDYRSLPGTMNMAIDEFLFLSLKESPQTALRFYRWERPTVSLGQGQDIDRVLDLEACRLHGVDVVRRITGGKLVLHDQEITYSLCSSDIDIFTTNLGESYRLISRGLMKGLKLLGLSPELSPATQPSYARGDLPCFAFPARDEVSISGRKIIGSAQRRVGHRFLQHGSLPLSPQADLLRQVSRLGSSQLPLKMTSLEEALGRPITFEEVVPYLVTGMEEFFNVQLVALGLSEAELKEVRRIQQARYENPAWTFCRQEPDWRLFPEQVDLNRSS